MAEKWTLGRGEKKRKSGKNFNGGTVAGRTETTGGVRTLPVKQSWAGQYGGGSKKGGAKKQLEGGGFQEKGPFPEVWRKILKKLKALGGHF